MPILGESTLISFACVRQRDVHLFFYRASFTKIEHENRLTHTLLHAMIIIIGLWCYRYARGPHQNWCYHLSIKKKEERNAVVINHRTNGRLSATRSIPFSLHHSLANTLAHTHKIISYGIPRQTRDSIDFIFRQANPNINFRCDNEQRTNSNK